LYFECEFSSKAQTKINHEDLFDEIRRLDTKPLHQKFRKVWR